MTDFHRLPADEQRHELAGMEQALAAKREIYRRQHGEGDHPMRGQTEERTERDGGNGINVGYKGARAQVTGPMALLASVFLAVGGSAGYIVYDGLKGIRADAGEIKVLIRQSAADHDLLACVVSLSPEERTRARMAPHRDGFQSVCPWLRPAGR